MFVDCEKIKPDNPRDYLPEPWYPCDGDPANPLLDGSASEPDPAQEGGVA
jgi:hypothetical protein